VEANLSCHGILRALLRPTPQPASPISIASMTQAEEGQYSWIMYATTLGVALLIAHFFFYGRPFLPPDDDLGHTWQTAKLGRSSRGYLNLVFVRHAECMHTAAAGTPSSVMRHAVSGKNTIRS